MKTENFWAPIIGALALLFMAIIIIADRFRRPEIYSKNRQSKSKNSQKS